MLLKEKCVRVCVCVLGGRGDLQKSDFLRKHEVGKRRRDRGPRVSWVCVTRRGELGAGRSIGDKPGRTPTFLHTLNCTPLPPRALLFLPRNQRPYDLGRNYL